MHSISKVFLPAITLLAMVQHCPAPIILPLAVLAGMGGVSVSAGSIAGVIGAAAGVAGAVEGGISAHHGRRDVEPKPREFMNRIKRQDTSDLGLGTAWSDCHSQLTSAYLTFSAPATSSK